MDSTNTLGVDLPVKHDPLDGQVLGKAGVQQQSVSGICQTFLPVSEQVSSLAEFLEDQTDEGYATSPAASSPGSWSAVPSPSTVDEDTISSIASLWDEMSSDSTVFRPSLKRTAEDLAVNSTAPKHQKVTDSSLPLVEGPLHAKAPHCDFTSALKHSQLLLHLAGTPADEADPLISSSQSKCQSSIESSKVPASRKATRPKARKALGLSTPCPSSHGDIQLVISDQPERHHRARYIIEGSRGCVKNEAKVGYPAVQLKGWNRPVELQVFIVTDQGKVRPHGYYQACKVTGQHATPCSEEEVDCTKVINIPWQPAENNGIMELRIDCVGILKLRNADVEHNGGLYRSKKKSTSVRMAFRVTLPEINVTLQTISSLICCTQPLGHPEIIKKSLTECSAAGGQELYIIGKNFISKNCEVNLLELSGAGKAVWSGSCEVDKSLFHKTHIVCTIPPYQDTNIKRPVEVFLVVTSGGGKSSELMAHPITYTPVPEPKTAIAPVQEEPVPDLSNAAVLQLLASRLTCTKDSSPPILSINDQIPLVSMGQPLDVKSADLVNQQKQALQQQIIQQTQQQSFEDLMKVAAGLMTKAAPVVQQQQQQLPLDSISQVQVPQAIVLDLLKIMQQKPTTLFP